MRLLRPLAACADRLLCTEDFEDRLAEIGWVVEHLDDLQADFLAIWGIDLDVDEPPYAARFFAMCRRTFSYDGVMAARLAELERREPSQPAPRHAAHVPTWATASQHDRQVQEVSLEQLARMHPDLIDH